MTYVYILRSRINSSKVYYGITTDLRRRFRQHNNGQSKHTAQFKPWTIEAYIAFSNSIKAKKFERYIKKSGGWRFVQRRLI